MKRLLFIILLMTSYNSNAQSLNICDLPYTNAEELLLFWKTNDLSYSKSEGSDYKFVFKNSESLVMIHADSAKRWMRSVELYSNNKKFIKKFLADNEKD